MEGGFCEDHEDSWLHALEKEYEEIGTAQLKMREKRGEKRNTEPCHLLCYFVLTPIHTLEKGLVVLTSEWLPWL